VSAVQLRLTAAGFGLPLRPAALAELSQFELAHVLASLGLDPEQREAAEEAVALVRTDRYGKAAV
jgi:hypothetical protein